MNNIEILALSAAWFGHNRLQQNPFWMPEKSTSPFICKPLCFEEQWHRGCTHCVHSPWHPEGQSRNPAWKQGNCKNKYNFLLWVQSLLNKDSSLSQEQYFLDSELGLVAVLWKSEEKQTQPCVWGPALQKVPLLLAIPSRLILEEAAKEVVVLLGGSVVGHFLQEGRAHLFFFSAFPNRTYLPSFSSPPSWWPRSSSSTGKPFASTWKKWLRLLFCLQIQGVCIPRFFNNQLN